MSKVNHIWLRMFCYQCNWCYMLMCDPFWCSMHSLETFLMQVISGATKNSARSGWSAKRPSTYPQADAMPCSPSRWSTALCRAAMRVVASPLRRAAYSGVRAHTCWCIRRTADSRRARRWGSNRSRVPSLADSLWAREGTWTAPSGRTARTARMSPSYGAQPTETAPSRIRS